VTHKLGIHLQITDYRCLERRGARGAGNGVLSCGLLVLVGIDAAAPRLHVTASAISQADQGAGAVGRSGIGGAGKAV
jgi:hypothetical protein